jgi:uncharacterized protein (DUF736 family)
MSKSPPVFSPTGAALVRLRAAPFGIFSLCFLAGPMLVQCHQEMVPDTIKEEIPMSNKLATLTLSDKGIYTGTLATMTVRTKINIVPNITARGEQPDYRIFANGNYEIGAAWKKTSETTGNDYLSVKMAAPELGPMAIYANVIALEEIGEDGVTHLMLWSARDAQATPGSMAA